MTSAAIQQNLLLLQLYPIVATEASYRARFAPGLDALRFGVQTGEINLQQLLVLPHHERRSIVEHGPYIDIYLGETRVYKRTSRTLLFASCPNVGRFLKPMHDRFAICLPDGFSNVLAVKLAVLYMEQCLLNPRVREAPWKVSGDFVSYIHLAELFAVIGMPQTARELETAIMKSLRERPLEAEYIRSIWARENARYPSKYAEAMADNIFTFICVAKIELFLVEFDIEPAHTYEERVKGGIQRLADTYTEPAGQARGHARHQMMQVEQMLKDPANVSLKLLVWSANILAATAPSEPAEWLEIRAVKAKAALHNHLVGMRKIVLMKTSDLEIGEKR